MTRALVSLAATTLAACSTVLPASGGPQQLFFERLGALCGRAFAGQVVAGDEGDREMASSRLVMHVRQCGESEIRIAFHVGGNRSRTWIVSRTGAGLRLKHDHRHRDGSEDAVSLYGGDTVGPGSARRQEFPADAHSRALFIRENLPASITNVWALEIVPGQSFSYELRRPNRHFRIGFDLARPVAPPPPPWGAR